MFFTKTPKEIGDWRWVIAPPNPRAGAKGSQIINQKPPIIND
jgi:hypothetical protein